jgi:hypothetical protein
VIVVSLSSMLRKHAEMLREDLVGPDRPLFSSVYAVCFTEGHASVLVSYCSSSVLISVYGIIICFDYVDPKFGQ